MGTVSACSCPVPVVQGGGSSSHHPRFLEENFEVIWFPAPFFRSPSFRDGEREAQGESALFASGWESWMPQPLCIQLILGSPGPATERAYTCGETGWFLTSQKMGQVRQQGTTESVSRLFSPSVKTDKPFLCCHPGSWARVPLVQLGSGIPARAWEKWGFQGF